VLRSSPLAALALLALAGCDGRYPPAPPHRTFDGLPISGTLADARAAGFTRCLFNNASVRCLRGGVMLRGHGPYDAAVDLGGKDGRGGFDRITLWHAADQHAVEEVGFALRAAGWRYCYTGEGHRGDQAIYIRPGSAARVSIDLSYWMKRRLRIFPEANRRKPRC
jgi:hypothetical protein